MMSNVLLSDSKPLSISNLQEETDLESSRPPRAGTLRDVYHKRKLKYAPSEILATPNVEVTQVESKVEKAQMGKRANKACF